MNQITVYFVPCDPAPANGYNILWRVFGSGDAYTDAGNFTESPAVFNDNINPDGSNYEGIIRSDCTESGESGTNYGTEIPWNSVVTENECTGGDAIFCATTHVFSDDLNVFEIANIGGVPGITVRVDMDSLVNINGGVIKVNSVPAFVGNFWLVVLDSMGNGALNVEINGVDNPGTVMVGHFTITSVSSGSIGMPDSYQISKAFL